METNLYTTTIPPMRKALLALSEVLEKACAFAESKKTSRRSFEEALLADRIIFDQLPLSAQIQIACDNAKGGAARLAGIEAPKFEDTEKTFAELRTRIEKTILFLDTVKDEVVGQEARRVTLSHYPEKHLLAHEYAREYLLPNFYFHVVTAYAILRKNGLAIGKSDYIGELPLHDGNA